MLPALYDPPPPLDPSDAIVVRLALLNPENGMPEIKIIAEVAGRICAVPAEVGSTINEGDDVVFVEAMLLYFKRESHAPFYATALLLVLNQLFSKDTRWTFATIGKFFEVNGRTFVELAAILAGCGLLIGAFSMTGVISSLANDLLRIAGDNAFLLLVMCAVTSLILGLGLTTTACYIFLAILVAPALEKVGLNRMAVHMPLQPGRHSACK